MKKIISLFQRNYDGDRLVRNDVVPGAEWVTNGEGIATRKYDGTCCMVKDGKLFRRYDAKYGKQPPSDFIPAQDPDPITGHWPGWVIVCFYPQDKYHREAFVDGLKDGTYELVGPKIGKNDENYEKYTLIAHADAFKYPECPRDFNAVKEFLKPLDIEGIVWHHEDGRMVKIKKRDFGLQRKIKSEVVK